MIRVVRTAAAAAFAALAIAVSSGAQPVTAGIGTAVSISCHLDGSARAGDAVMVCASKSPE